MGIQEVSDRVTKLGLRFDAESNKATPLTTEEMVEKENDRRLLLKSPKFQKAVQMSLSTENSLEVILSMVQFFNDLIKISKDSLTKKFVASHISLIVILLGHGQVISPNDRASSGRLCERSYPNTASTSKKASALP
jgi:uncharacterized protein YnzC (UPF0291/DUF896 family)